MSLFSSLVTDAITPLRSRVMQRMEQEGESILSNSSSLRTDTVKITSAPKTAEGRDLYVRRVKTSTQAPLSTSKERSVKITHEKPQDTGFSSAKRPLKQPTYTRSNEPRTRTTGTSFKMDRTLTDKRPLNRRTSEEQPFRLTRPTLSSLTHEHREDVVEGVSLSQFLDDLGRYFAASQKPVHTLSETEKQDLKVLKEFQKRFDIPTPQEWLDGQSLPHMSGTCLSKKTGGKGKSVTVDKQPTQSGSGSREKGLGKTRVKDDTEPSKPVDHTSTGTDNKPPVKRKTLAEILNPTFDKSPSTDVRPTLRSSAKKTVESDSSDEIGRRVGSEGREMAMHELYGSTLKDVTFNQHGNNTCYLLASLDSLLHLPQEKAQALLNRIKIKKNRDTYQVTFPGQPGAITVRESDVKYGGAKSSAKGIQIIEQAYLKIPGVRRGLFDESANALKSIFGEEGLAPISIQNSKNIEGAVIEGDYEWLNAGHDLERGKSFESDDKTLLVAKAGDDTLMVTPTEHCRVTEPGKKGEPTVYESRDGGLVLRVYTGEDGTITAIHRRKLHEGEHHIGPFIIDHIDRAKHFKQLITNAKDVPESDVLTAIRIGAPRSVSTKHKGQTFSYKEPTGGHYYSIRLHDSTPEKIVLADPFNTAKAIEVPFDDFMRDYNIEGMRIS